MADGDRRARTTLSQVAGPATVETWPQPPGRREAGGDRGWTRENHTGKSSRGSRGHYRGPTPRVLLSAHPAVLLNGKDPGAATDSCLGPRPEERPVSSRRPPLLLPCAGENLRKGSQPGNTGKGKRRWPRLAGECCTAGRHSQTAPGAKVSKGGEGAASGKGGAASSAQGHLDDPRASPP